MSDTDIQPIDVSGLGAEGNLAVTAIEYWARYATDSGVRTDCEHVLEYIRTLHAQIPALSEEAWDAGHDAGWWDAQNDRNGHPRRITPNPFRAADVSV